MKNLKVTLIQSNIIWENRDANLEKFSAGLKEINDNPDLIILPEMFATGFTMNVEKCAEREDGDTVNFLKEMAQKKNCVITGTVLIEESGKYFNRLFWMRPDGSYETYDKRHLFRMGKEHLTMSQGTERKIVELNVWKINLQICYDLRFPVWSKNRYNDGDYEYDLLIYVANWPQVRSSAYKALIPARAIENQCYTIWANRVGLDGNNVFHSGDSMICDPYGKIVSQADAGKEQIISQILSKQKLEEFRKKFTVGTDWDEFSIVK